MFIQLLIQLHSSQHMLSTDPLEYTFEVAYDMISKIESMPGELSAMDFEVREQAEPHLIKNDQTFVSLLADRYTTEKDPQVRATLGRVLKSIQNPQADEDEK